MRVGKLANHPSSTTLRTPDYFRVVTENFIMAIADVDWGERLFALRQCDEVSLGDDCPLPSTWPITVAVGDGDWPTPSLW